MNPFINRLLANIPGGLTVPQDKTPSLVINNVSSLSISGTTLYVTVGNQSAWYDLYGITVKQLAQQINALTPTTVVQDGTVELLSLADGQLFSKSSPVAQVPDPIAPGMWVSVAATLYLPTDQTFAVLGMMARMQEGNKRFGNKSAAQANLQAAFGMFADWWGASTGIARYQGEPDNLYVQRIAAMRFQPTQNNYAIENLFAALGYQATVTDTSPGAFSVQIQVPSSPPQGWVYTLGQMADILSRVKSGGYQGTVTVQSSLADNVIVTDSLSVTLNPSVWTVGSVTVGQFNV